jgi:helicase SWR1
MGMMNILMQLRKVCNHPDLFEARAIVTPFVLDPISCSVASCIPDALVPISPFGNISESVSLSIWSGSHGEPSISAALGHDILESQMLLDLETNLIIPVSDLASELKDFDRVPVSFSQLTMNILKMKHNIDVDNISFLNAISKKRCRNLPFPYSATMIKTVQVSQSTYPRSRIASHTPDSLLSMLKDQNERARSMDELIKRFVFCVPKARTAIASIPRRIGGRPCRSTKSLTEMLQEPVNELLKPFRESIARLQSEFPDKKLIQFDSGKLQVLAELLRERKRGGHKVLIFTQMGKMVIFSNLFKSLSHFV